MLKPILLKVRDLSIYTGIPQVKAPIALIALVVLISFGCGKRKPPVPPKERVAQRAEVSGFQRGNKVVLTWTMPARNASAGNVLNIARADVYRLTEPLTTPQGISEEEFAGRSVLIAAIPIAESDFGLKTLSFTDTLEFAGQAARLRYAVRFVNSTGQKAAFSNFFLIEPASRIAGSPTSLTVDIKQERIGFSWTAPTANVDGSQPLNLIGFNVYRSGSEREPAKLLNKIPVTDLRYEDKSFEFDTSYFYFVRAVSVGSDGQPVESGESNIVTLKAKDIFSPSAPAAITLAATPTTISIFFPMNPESDIAGYKIYRSIDATTPKSEWQVLTKTLVTTNTFQDNSVESGKTYYYYITASDKSGNVSEPSEVVSETVR